MAGVTEVTPVLDPKRSCSALVSLLCLCLPCLLRDRKGQIGGGAWMSRVTIFANQAWVMGEFGEGKYGGAGLGYGGRNQSQN